MASCGVHPCLYIFFSGILVDLSINTYVYMPDLLRLCHTLIHGNVSAEFLSIRIAISHLYLMRPRMKGQGHKHLLTKV